MLTWTRRKFNIKNKNKNYFIVERACGTRLEKNMLEACDGFYWIQICMNL